MSVSGSFGSVPMAASCSSEQPSPSVSIWKVTWLTLDCATMGVVPEKYCSSAWLS